MDTDIQKTIKLIGGVEAKSEQVQRVQAIAHSLGISKNDSMFPILIALETYYGAFSNMPREAATISAELMEKFKATAEVQSNAGKARLNVLMQQTVSELVRDIKPTINEALNDAVKEVQNKERMQWALGGALAAIVAVAGFGMLLHAAGFRAGAASMIEQRQTVTAVPPAGVVNTPRKK